MSVDPVPTTTPTLSSVPASQYDRDPDFLQIKDEEIEYAEYTFAPLSPSVIKGEPVDECDSASDDAGVGDWSIAESSSSMGSSFKAERESGATVYSAYSISSSLRLQEIRVTVRLGVVKGRGGGGQSRCRVRQDR